MLKNYFRIAARSLRKHRIFTFINVFGLSVGLASAILIGSFLYSELHYDDFAKQANQIYRLGLRLTQNGGSADYPDVDVAVGEGIKNIYPEVLASARCTGQNEMFVSLGDRKFKEQHLTFCDSNFLQMFSLHLVEGDDQTALVAPNSLVVTKAMATKYFGSVSALGKTLNVGRSAFKITGVLDKVPENAHFHFDGFISMTSNYYGVHGHSWSNLGFYTYLLLHKGTNPKRLEAKFPELITKFIAPEAVHDMGISLAEAQKGVNTWHFYLMPLRDIHLYSNTKYELEPNGDIQYVYIFGALAVFILLLACVNFTNLSTASSAGRSREVGIRKVLGSLQKQLIWQFLTESVLLTCIAMFFAYVLVYLLLPSFNHLAGKQISFGYFAHAKTILAALVLIVVVGVLAGIYPAFFLSSFQTIRVLKGAVSQTPAKRGGLRSSLVVFQLMVSTALVIATLIVEGQLHFLQHKKLGYDKDQVLVLQDTYGLDSNQYAFKQKLLEDSRVVSATLSNDVPVGRSEGEMDGSQVYAQENQQHESESEIHANFFHVDFDYLTTLGIAVVSGRNFSPSFASDSSAVVINEAAVRDLGWKNNDAAIGKVIISSGRHQYNVVGVVRDFNYASAKQRIVPVLMMLGHNRGTIMVKIKTQDVTGFLMEAKKNWAAYNARLPFSYYFLDEKFNSLYKAEERTGEIFGSFALIAISIASLGLFGLVAYSTEQRKKEIGIRRVLGATIAEVLLLLSKEFLGLVSVAIVLAIPIAWWAMHNWLNNFAYRIQISWTAFALAGVLAFFMVLGTVGLLAVRAARENPSNSLRAE
jgi:putative ABC transport system permease protein